MRKNHFVVVFLLLPVAAKPQTANAPLELRAELKRERYCEVDEEISSLRVIFKLRLANKRNASLVIVQRPYPLLFVSRTVSNLQRGKHEFELTPPDFFGQPTVRPEQWVVIRPGQVFEFETMETTIPTPKTAKYSRLEALAPGIHYLQVVIQAQPEGTFMSDVVSQPVELRVLKNPKTENCQ